MCLRLVFIGFEGLGASSSAAHFSARLFEILLLLLNEVSSECVTHLRFVGQERLLFLYMLGEHASLLLPHSFLFFLQVPLLG